MKFTPKTEQQLKELEDAKKFAKLLQDDEYDAEIYEAKDHVSKEGKESIKLSLKVFDGSGATFFMWDYLTPSFPKKWKHAALACGLKDKYESGDLEPSDFANKCCRVAVVIDDNKKYNEKNGKDYPPSNKIDDYIVGPTKEKPKTVGKTSDLNDAVPW